MKTLFVFLAVALVLPFATALSCKGLVNDDLQLCNEIISSNASSTEKDLLISDIFNPEKFYPNHDFIYSWNVGLDLKNTYNGVKYNQVVIKNAWVKTYASMPSVIEDNFLYIPESGKVLSEYNYNVELPTGKQRGDCKTKYYLTSNIPALNIYLNNNLIGHDKINSYFTNLEHNSSITLKSELSVSVKYRLKHYQYNDYGYCVYVYDEYKTDTLRISDSLNSRLYKINPVREFKILNNYLNVTKGSLTASNYSSIKLTFNSSYYEKNLYTYSYVFDPTYSILTLKVERTNNTNSGNLRISNIKDGIEFVVKDSSNCKIDLFTHFKTLTKDCDLSFNKTEFELKTNRTDYYENETIIVEIIPKGLQLNITYANKSILAQDYVSFTAVRGENKISAQLNDYEARTYVNVKDEKNDELLKDSASITFFGFIIYSFLKKYYLAFNFI